MKRMVWMLAVSAIVTHGGVVWAQEMCTDSVYVAVEGSRVTVFHAGALYNCCTTQFDYDVSLDGDRLIVVENEVLDDPCYCICCMDLEVVIEDVPPGEYILEFHWYDYESDRWRVWTLPVAVQVFGRAPGDPYVSSSSRSECYDETSPVRERDEAACTWTLIKALYR